MSIGPVYRSSCANVTVSVLTTNCISSHWCHDHYSDELCLQCMVYCPWYCWGFILVGSLQWGERGNQEYQWFSSYMLLVAWHITLASVFCATCSLLRLVAVVYWRRPAAMRQHLAALNDVLVHRQIRVQCDISQLHSVTERHDWLPLWCSGHPLLTSSHSEHWCRARLTQSL